MEKYLMKYDVDGRLYTYIELNSSGKVESLIKLSGKDKLLRYNGSEKEKYFIKYDSECMLAHRFQASESWITVVKNKCNLPVQYEFPKKKTIFSFDKNNSPNLFTVSPNFSNECMSILGTVVSSSNSNKNWHPNALKMSRLSNSSLFISTETSKNIKNAKEKTNTTN